MNYIILYHDLSTLMPKYIEIMIKIRYIGLVIVIVIVIVIVLVFYLPIRYCVFGC